MFTPMFHGQNRNKLIIPPPIIWYNADNVEFNESNEVIKINDISEYSNFATFIESSPWPAVISTDVNDNNYIDLFNPYGAHFLISGLINLNNNFTIICCISSGYAGVVNGRNPILGFTFGGNYSGQIDVDYGISSQKGSISLTNSTKTSQEMGMLKIITFTNNSVWDGINEVSSYDSNDNVNDIGLLTYLFLGNSSDANKYFSGGFYEMLVYQENLPDYEITKVVNYLNNKYLVY